jgi:hypothetical protein
VHGDEPGGEGRTGVVVGAVADVRDLARFGAGQLHEPVEERGVRLLDAQARRAGDDVHGQAGRAGPSLELLVLVACEADDHPGLSQALEALERVGIEVVGRIHEALPCQRSFDAQMAPELPVLLPALDRLAERRPHDVRSDSGRVGHLAPVALLVDERLADIEDHRAHGHRLSPSPVAGIRARGPPAS